MRLDVDGVDFTFDDDWTVVKYDESRFYREVFIKVHDGVKAVDLVAIEYDQSSRADLRVVLIEVKDYRHPTATGPKPSELAQKVAQKVTATLAGLVIAARSAPDSDEQALARRAQLVPRIEVVLHCDDRPVPIVDPSELTISLKKRLKPIVDSVLVASQRVPGGLWAVTDQLP